VEHHQSIGFIGAGNMTTTLVQGIRQLHQNLPMIVSNPSTTKLEVLKEQYQTEITVNNVEVVLNSDIVILAVKPNVLPMVCDEIRTDLKKEQIIVSLAAGVSLVQLYQYLGQEMMIVRAMPNTPCAIGYGICGLYVDVKLKFKVAPLLSYLFEGLGQLKWLKDEKQIDDIIAFAGSAPAYFYYFMQCLQKVAIQRGLDDTLAKDLIANTALGASMMVTTKNDISFSQLIEQVASKGGTTAQALSVLEENNLSVIVEKMISAVIERAQNISN